MLEKSNQLPSLGSAHDQVDLVAPAPGTDEARFPVKDDRLGTIAAGEFSGIGLDLAATISAPHDQADACSRCRPECHRRAGLGFHPRRRLLAAPARGGAYTLGGGNGSRTGCGSSLSRMLCRVRIRAENGYRSASIVRFNSATRAI